MIEQIKEIKFTEIVNKEISSNSTDEKTEKTEKIDNKKFCDEETCKKENENKYLECKFRKNIEKEIDNNGQKLKINLKKNSNEEDIKDLEEIENCMKNEDIGCRVAAHHIISGNQVFKELTEIVRLTQGIGYDINCAENGIFLPTNQENFGKVKKKDIEAFEIMDKLGRQWHVGGHSYKLSKDIIEENPKLEEIENYAEEVRKKVQRKFIVEKYGKTCREKKIEQEKILRKINEISLEIKNYLRNFSKNPKDSYPYYVSKIALEYAFKIPQTMKIMTLFKMDEKIYCKKYRFEKNIEKKFFYVREIRNEEIKKINLNIKEDIEEFAKYCGNIQHYFVYSNLIDEIDKIFLPEDFVNILKKNSPIKNELAYLNEEIIEITNFFQENMFFNKKIRERKEFLEKKWKN